MFGLPWDQTLAALTFVAVLACFRREADLPCRRRQRREARNAPGQRQGSGGRAALNQRRVSVCGYNQHR